MAEKRGRKKALLKLPKGTILQDVAKVQWQIIEPIGEGGFGVIYSVNKLSSSDANSVYVAKVEPHTNGPLFVEKNFFMRNLQPSLLKEYKEKKKLPFLGLPAYLGGGSLVHNNVQYRFLIMERFGDSINKKLNSGSCIDYSLLGMYCSQIVDSLMYIHDKGYAHMDIKPENLLLKHGICDKVYLIDFGIVDRYTTEKVFKPDKKKQHNGTILYNSRDSHEGVVTKRGDFEVLGYNILQWCGIQLPWFKDVKNANIVFEKKAQFMLHIKKNLSSKVPEKVIDYFTYINNLKHNESPDYNHIKSIFKSMGTKNSVDDQMKKASVEKSFKRRALFNGDCEDGRLPTVSPSNKRSKERIFSEDSNPVILTVAMQAVINNRKNAAKNGSKYIESSQSVSEEVPKKRRGRPKKV